MNKARWSILLVCIGFVVALLSVPVRAALSVPSGSGTEGSQLTGIMAPGLPHAFYGAVTLDGQPAPVGMSVEARGAGVLTGIAGNPIVIDTAGQYGAAGPFSPKLIVQGNVTDNTPIAFYVGGIRAQCAVPGGPWQDTYPFTGGAVTELNLRVFSPTATATATPTATATATATATPTATATATATPTATATATATPTATARIIVYLPLMFR